MAFTGPSADASAVPPPAPSGAAPPPYGAVAAYGASGVIHMQPGPPMQPAQGTRWAPHYPQALPAGHHAFIGAPYQPTGAGYGTLLAPPPVGGYGPPVLAPPYGALSSPPSLGGYGPPTPAPPYEGLLPPPVPMSWDPTLLAVQHSASSLSSSVGGGDWYMDSGSSGFGPFGAGPRAPFMERCAVAPPGMAPSPATTRLRDSLPRGRV
nr:formin-like protein 20 [Aegilops tauschii subsp. strangulata]